MEKPTLTNGERPSLRQVWDLVEYAIHRIDAAETRTDSKFTRVYYTMMGGLAFIVTTLIAMGVLL